MPLELESLVKAVGALQKVLAKSDDTKFMDDIGEIARDAVRSGVIQHFEFTYELCWKFMKRWIETNVSAVEVDGVSRRELFRQAAEQRLITDVEQWMRYHDARNRMSHTYDPETAKQVYEAAHGFTQDAVLFLESLKKRND